MIKKTLSYLSCNPHGIVLKQVLRRHLEQTCPEYELRRWFDPLRIHADDTAATVCISFPHALFRRWFMDGPKETFERCAASFVNRRFTYETPASPRRPKTNAFSLLTRPDAIPGNGSHRPAHKKTSHEINTRRQSFDNFLANHKNDFPLAAAKEFAEGRMPPSHIPFVIYGASGSGKTHLLLAVAGRLREWHSQETLYGNAETLFSQLPSTTGNVIIDDLQRIASSSELQDQAVSMMETAAARGCLVMAAMDAHPFTSLNLSQKIRQRLTAGLVVELKKPDLDIRRQYTQQKNIDLELCLTREEVFSLARTYQDFRVIDGALNKIQAYRSLVSRQSADITQILKFPSEPHTLTPAAVMEHVAKQYAVSVDELPGTNKKKNIVQARQVAVFLCRELLGLSLSQIGQIFGNRDHSSIAYTIKKIKQLQQDNKDMHNAVSRLKKMCLSQ